MRPPQQCTAKLVEKIEHNPRYIQYYFEYSQPAQVEFDAGQYVSMQVSSQGHRRSYSIASSPEKAHGFELLIDVTPGGIGTQYLQNLHFSDEVKVLSPMGVFTLANAVVEPSLVFVATGSGVAPFRSMILDLLQEKRETKPIYLYWGMRHAEELFWIEEWQQLADAFPNFHFHPVISRPMPEWTLCQGRVTDCLQVHEVPKDAGYYLCGNQAMITETLQLLQERGIPQERIHHEKFF